MPQHDELGLPNTRPVIRRCSLADSGAIFEICQRAPEAAQWPKESYNQAISAGQIVLLAEVAERVCGFLVARVIGSEVEILNMAIDVAHRRQGIGSWLLTAGVLEAQAHHAQCIYLEVRESNHAGIAFYHKHGFCGTGKRPGYYRDPTEDAVLMEKKLTA
jgi:ribosomal-protein-alanine acetyltransferase